MTLTHSLRQTQWLTGPLLERHAPLKTFSKLARVCGVPVGQRLGGRLATTLVATINVIIFSLFFSVVYFSHRRSARIKKLRMPKNLRVETYPEPVGYFGAPWWPYWILQAVRRCKRWVSAPGAAMLVLISKSSHIIRMRVFQWTKPKIFNFGRNKSQNFHIRASP